ncbi:MAG: hypothetical protein ACO3GP_01950, partial [Candidatus Limnocylindrus sp.]
AGSGLIRTMQSPRCGFRQYDGAAASDTVEDHHHEGGGAAAQLFPEEIRGKYRVFPREQLIV